MAYARPRNMNNELSMGMTDGKYKRVVRNRGGDVEPGHAENLKQLDDIWYGIHETDEKIRPDTLVRETPYYVPTREARQV